MIHASLFSGIGGPEVAAAMLGWDNAFHCEINPFGRAILEYWFPNSTSYDDITKTDFRSWRGKIDILTGGFPCQPFSYAGRRGGADDNRYLWPQMLRAIDEIRPTWVVGENVAGLATMVEGGVLTEVGSSASLFGEGDGVHGYELEQTFTIERICKDLERLGYSVQPVLVPAAAVGAPHRRDRIFILAHRDADWTGAELSAEREVPTGSEAEPWRIRAGICGEVRGIIANSDRRYDCGEAGGYEGEGGKERLQERDEVREPGKPDNVRPEVREDAADTADVGLRNTARSEAEGGVCGEMEGERDHTERIISVKANGLRWTSPDTEGEQGYGHGLEQPKHSVQKQEQFGGGSGENDCILHESSARGYATDTDGGRGGEVPPPVHAGLADGNEPFRDGCVGDATDTNRRGHARTKEGRGEREGVDALRRGGELLPENRWRHFPTISPVHRGNDGLPFDVDDLTISATKWRTESLKAYGNAIVPQVMYEIFKAIDEL